MICPECGGRLATPEDWLNEELEFGAAGDMLCWQPNGIHAKVISVVTSAPAVLTDASCHADHCPGPHQGLDKLKPTWYLRAMLALTNLSARLGPEVLIVTKAVLHIVCHLFNLPHPEGIL